MYLPGMRYQDHAWGQVRRALGEAALVAIRALENPNMAGLQERMCQHLFSLEKRLLGRKATNWMGEDGLVLALDIAMALGNIPKFAKKTQSLLANAAALSDAAVWTSANRLFSELRDELDARNFESNTGEEMKAEWILALRKTEQAEREVAKVLREWRANPEYASLVLGRELDQLIDPIEVRQVMNGKRCKAGWVIRWSQYHHLYHVDSGGQPVVGPLHTKSKRCTFNQENVERWLRMTDPLEGTFRGIVSSYVPDVEILAVLIRLSGELDEDDERPSRTVSSEDANKSSVDDEKPPTRADDDSEADEEETTNEASGDAIFSSPGKHISDEMSVADDQEDVAPIATSCLELIDELPLRVGVLLQIAGYDEDLLFDLLNDWKFFAGESVSLKTLTRAKLARNLGKLRGKDVSPYCFDQEVKTAHEKFVACVKSSLMKAAERTGEE